MNKNKLIEEMTDSELEGVYRSPAHSDGEKVGNKLLQSAGLAEILAKQPLDEDLVSRRSLIGIVTKNVLDVDIDHVTWRENMPHTIDLLNGHASKQRPIHIRQGTKHLDRDEEAPVTVNQSPSKLKSARLATRGMTLKNSARRQSQISEDEFHSSGTVLPRTNTSKSKQVGEAHNTM